MPSKIVLHTLLIFINEILVLLIHMLFLKQGSTVSNFLRAFTLSVVTVIRQIVKFRCESFPGTVSTSFRRSLFVFAQS